MVTENMKFILKMLGRNLDLPNAADVEDPKHGQKANNSRKQKVVYDAMQGKWVMPQNFSGKAPVTIRGNGYVYTEFGIFAEDDTDFSHPMTLDDVLDIRQAERGQNN